MIPSTKARAAFSPRTFLGLEGPLAIAHRGGAEERPENTIAAFDHAVDLGYRCIETDERATRDGIAVIFHDEELDRLTEDTGPIAERTWAELETVRIGGSEHVPRLEDVLGAWTDLRFIIDPKSDDVVAPLVEALSRTGARERVCLGTFSADRMRRFRASGPGCTSCTPNEVTRLRVASLGLPTGTIGAGCAPVPLRHKLLGLLSVPVVDAAFVRAAHSREIPVQI